MNDKKQAMHDSDRDELFKDVKQRPRAETIDLNYVVPSKIMVVQPGVELIEPNGGRRAKGEPLAK
jgi:hypothetical protein